MEQDGGNSGFSDDEDNYMNIASDEMANSNSRAGKKQKKKPEDEDSMLLDLANRVVDVSGASSSVWLVKVPAFLAESWKSAGPNAGLGTVKIGQPSTGQKTPSVSIHLNDSVGAQVPKNYNLKFISNPPGTMLVFDEDSDGNAHSITGTVQYECHSTPIIDDDYLNIMRLRKEEAERPKRTTQLVEAKGLTSGITVEIYGIIEGNVQGIKQISNSFLTSTSLQVQSTKKRKAEDFRRDRLPREELIEIVFKAYEKQQYWSLKEMVDFTNQPVAYMKEILADVCVYVTRGPYKATYQLKPEFKNGKEED